MRLFAAVIRYIEVRGVYFTYGQNMATDFLAQEPGHSVARVRTLVMSVILARNHGDLAKARLLAEECLALARELDDTLSAASTLTFMASLSLLENDPQQAIALDKEAIVYARSRAEREPRALYIALFNWGIATVRWAIINRPSPFLRKHCQTFNARVTLHSTAAF